MGLWEEAERLRLQADKAAYAERQRKSENQQRRAHAVATQQAAVREFVEGMHRLRIPPVRHGFFTQSLLSGKKALSRFSGVTGWSLLNPREPTRLSDWTSPYPVIVVTPDATVYEVTGYDSMKPQLPRDLSTIQSFSYGWGGDFDPLLLTDLLRSALLGAMRGS
jgi:hypothetical protein